MSTLLSQFWQYFSSPNWIKYSIHIEGDQFQSIIYQYHFEGLFTNWVSVTSLFLL